MTYSKTTWASGDTITAAKLSNLEAGVVEQMLRSPGRQTILQGKVDSTTGAAAFLQIGTGLAVNLLATATALVLSFANGGTPSTATGDPTAVISADVTSAWSSLPANQTVYLGIDYNSGTPAYGWTLTAPVIQAYAPSTGAGATAPGGGTAANAIDANAATKLTSSSQSSPFTFFQRDYGAYFTITQLQATNLFFGGTSSTFVFETSLDGSTWTTFGTSFSVATVTGTNYTQSGSAYARYYRLRMSANVGTATAQLDDINETKGAVTGAIWWYDPSTGAQKYWNGSAWTAQQRVFVGYCVTGAAAVSAVQPNAIGSIILAGQVIAPGQAACKIYRTSSTQSLTNVSTKMAWNATQYDHAAVNADLTNNRIVIREAGTYLVMVNHSYNGNGRTMYIYKNGSSVAQFGSPSSCSNVLFTVEECVPGDYFESYTLFGTGGQLDPGVTLGFLLVQRVD